MPVLSRSFPDPPPPPFAPSGANYEQILSIYLSIGCGVFQPQLRAPPPCTASFFCSGPDSASMSCQPGIPSTSNSPEATQASATSSTKPPHGRAVIVRSPRQSWSQEEEEEEEEAHSDTAVDDTAAGRTSEPLAALPKDNDDNGSEYIASSSDEDPPVPAKRCRESARLRGGVRVPPSEREELPPYLSQSPFSEGRGRKRSRSQSEESVPESTPPVTYGRPGASKRSTGSNIRSHSTDFLRIYDLVYPPTQSHTRQADGVGRGTTDTPSGGVHANVVKRPREYNRTFSTRPPRKRAARSTTSESMCRTVDAPAGGRTPPKPRVTAMPPDDGSAAVEQFLSDIGLGQSHLRILLEEGIKTQQDLDGLRRMEKECVDELRDVLRARGFTAFEFSKVEYAVRIQHVL
ncbi:hypothetical protein EDB87DRAFT_311537 [Lactarius vividus]|nr:hypothetical protein EDB87DRAFT_311537 [Lactarius vividus]